MRVSRVGVVVALFSAVALSASAGIRYEFQQVKQSSKPGVTPIVLIGEAIIDGDSSRVEYKEGSTMGAGQYIVTTNGGAETTFVDPATETYITRSNRGGASGIDRLNLEIENFRSNHQMLGTGPSIAGFPTEHHRVTLNYDLVVSIGQLKLKQKIETVIDKYTTLAFGDVATAFFGQQLPSTGNPQIDQVIEAEIRDVPGLPLKQSVRMTSTADDSKLAGSQIQVERQQVQTTESTVTKIERIGVKPGVFQIPVTYTRVERGVSESPISKLETTTEIVDPTQN